MSTSRLLQYFGSRVATVIRPNRRLGRSFSRNARAFLKSRKFQEIEDTSGGRSSASPQTVQMHEKTVEPWCELSASQGV